MEKENNGLLLDIDGVLNNYSTDRYGPYSNQSIEQLKNLIRGDKQSINESWWDHTFELELSNLQTLRVMIKKYNIKRIVICSTWRHVFTMAHLQLMFISKGYPDIADLFIGSTDICTKEDRERFGMTKRERTIEVANYVLGYPRGYEGKWYVLDDDVTEDDINSIKDIKNVKSLYFEFKATLQEYKRKEEMLLDSLVTGEIAIHTLDKYNESDDENMKEIKSRYRIIKSAILDPKMKIGDMFNIISREMKHLEIAALFLKEEKEKKNVRGNKRRDTSSSR